MKYWEIIADNLKKAGWSLGWVSAVDSNGRIVCVADPHRGDGQRFVVRANEKLTAFLELEAATRALAASCLDEQTRFLPNSPNAKTPIPQVLIHRAMARVSLTLLRRIHRLRDGGNRQASQ
jgi:hypothetical protein